MFRNYLLVALRNMRRNAAFSFINISGLAMGIACSLLIALWVQDEYRVDNFFKNGERIYSVFERQYHDGIIDAGHNTPGLLSQELKKAFPEVQFAAGFTWNESNTFEANSKVLNQNGNHAGEDYFRIFNYPLLKGTAATALASPLSIAVSRKMAEDFFGSPEKAYGQTVRWQNQKDFKITAVFDNIPSSSSAQFDYLLNWDAFLEENPWAKEWGNNAPATFIMLRKGTDERTFAGKIERFIENFNKEENFVVKLDIQRYGDRYLYSNFENGELSGGRLQYVRLFSIVAIFILLIACINFMNLTTARSLKRSKEIGIRKVAGAFRLALVRQFMGEALLFVLLSAVIALLVVTFVLPFFNELTGKQIRIPFSDTYFLSGLACLLFFTGLLSGSYPAFYLSSFDPVRVLKGSIKFSTAALWFRKGLVVFQFILSIVLIIGTIVVSRQVDYIQSVHLGYDRENLVYIPLNGNLVTKYALFKSKALQMPGVKNLSRITQNPTKIENSTGGVQWQGKDPNAMVQFTYGSVGYDFSKTMNVQLAQGRDFSKDLASDSTGYLINETAAKLIGYQDPVNKPLTLWQVQGKIIGVVRDFHFNSLHEPIQPMILRLGESEDAGYVLARLEKGKTKQALAALETIYKDLNPKFPFAYRFSDDEYQQLYTSEVVVGKLSNGFAVLAILISCLGLLGLAMFTAQQRTKEFGIRKVLGASPSSLFRLLSKEFFVLVCVALLIASPLAWYFMDAWLMDYAYRINLSWWMFAAAGTIAILIALMTISFQAGRAAVANPVKSLRTE